MRVRRGLLFLGLVLVPLGAIPLLVQAGSIDPARIVDVWRLWPLVLIGIGLVFLGGRSWLSLLGVAVTALTVGTIGGTAIASGGAFLGAFAGCGPTSGETTSTDQTGDFDVPAEVRLELNCGTMVVNPTDGPHWTVHATSRGDPPTIDSGSDHLSVTSPDSVDHNQGWTIGLPRGQVRSLDITANAATTTADLGTGSIAQVSGTFNAGDVRVSAGSAKIAAVDLTMNAGRIRLTLGAGSTTGTISANAGAIDLCVPSASALHLTVEDQLTFVTNLGSRGLSRDGNVWARAGSGGDTIDLSVSGNAATFNLDPNGGC